MVTFSGNRYTNITIMLNNKKTLFLKANIFLISCLFLISSLQAEVLAPTLNSISTVSPKQTIKALTASTYLLQINNDFDRDGIQEIIIGANCREEFCDNYIFKLLKNKRFQYIGFAQFHHNAYELVWRDKETLPDILFFKQENVGQGCFGRLKHGQDGVYRVDKEVCRLPKSTGELLGAWYSQNKQKNPIKIKKHDPDYIDFSDVTFDDSPEDLYPEPAEEPENK